MARCKTATVVLAVIAIALMIALTKADERVGGKDVFLKYKCDLCRSVSSAGITARNEKSGAPDLLDVTVRHDKAWIPD